MRLLVSVFLAILLAGCAADAPAANSGGSTNSPSAAPGVASQAPVLLGDRAATIVSETFTGTFAFQDNDQYMGAAADSLGQSWTNIQSHDLSGLVPAGLPFALTVVADADAGSGDIDVFFDGAAVADYWCECPFGSHNELFAYGTGKSTDLTLMVQFDEIHGEPTDTGVPVQGFDYSVEVRFEAGPSFLPPGIPVALHLAEPGDAVTFVNHTQSIVVYRAGGAQVAVLESGEAEFRLEGNATPGEYVFIQRLDGAVAEATVATAAETAPQARLLSTVKEFGAIAIPDGEVGSTTFDAPATVIEVGGCGIAGDVEVDPSFEMLDPAGNQWAHESTSGVALFGWGTCQSNWLGGPDQQPGTWTLSFTDTAGHDRQLMHWFTYFQP